MKIDIKVGDKAQMKKIIEEKDINLFAELSTDINPVHLDREYAETTVFKKRIAHGMFYGSFVSALLANQLPGPGSIYMGQNFKFLAPVYIGDTIITTVEVKSIISSKSIIHLSTYARNQANKLVLDGEATIKYYGDKRLV